jgi:hypothetical protein
MSARSLGSSPYFRPASTRSKNRLFFSAAKLGILLVGYPTTVELLLGAVQFFSDSVVLDREQD